MVGKKVKLTNPRFNMREVAKQLLLVEDHLASDEKFCADCVRKHLMTVEALGEEAVALDPDSDWVKEAKSVTRRAKGWLVKFEDGLDRESLAKSIRPVRKGLINKLADPR
jgi:hypothetical protein